MVPGRLRRVVCNPLEASAGYKRCSPWWRRSQHPGGMCLLLTDRIHFLHNCACISALSLTSRSHSRCLHLPSHAPFLPLQRSLGLLLSLRRPVPELAYIHPLMFIKQLLTDYSGWGWEECLGVPQKTLRSHTRTPSSKRLYWLGCTLNVIQYILCSTPILKDLSHFLLSNFKVQ